MPVDIMTDKLGGLTWTTNNAGYDTPKYMCFSFRRNTVNDKPSGRLFCSFGPAEANDRSPKRDRRTVSWLEVDYRSLFRDGMSASRLNRSNRYQGADS